MRTFTTLAALTAFAQQVLAQQALFINSPASLVQCQPALLTFGGGSGAPYFISALPAGQVSATPIYQFPEQSSTTYTWTVNLPAGTNLTLAVRDSSGAVQYASPVAIQSGTSDACLDAAGASSASAVGAVGSTAAAASTTAAASTRSVSSAASSTLISSAASATVTAAAGTPSTVPSSNGTETAGMGSSYNFTCGPNEGDLTYGITVAELEGVSLTRAVAYFQNWTATAPGPVTNSSGTGIGATRMYSLNGSMYDETLQVSENNATTGSLHQQWNFTEATPVTIGSNLTLFNEFNDLTVYTNTTTNETSIQYFVLACYSNQAQGLTNIATGIQSVIGYFAQQLNGSNVTSSGPPRPRRTVRLF